jgi:hypothetical protein
MTNKEIAEQKQIKIRVMREHFGATKEQVEQFETEFENKEGFEPMDWTCGIDEVEQDMIAIIKEGINKKSLIEQFTNEFETAVHDLSDIETEVKRVISKYLTIEPELKEQMIQVHLDYTKKYLPEEQAREFTNKAFTK